MNQIEVRLRTKYWVLLWLLMPLYGLGLWLHLANNKRVPKWIDSDGIRTRSGRRHLWADYQRQESQRLHLGSTTGPRLGGGVTLFFKTGKVTISTEHIQDLPAVLAFLEEKSGIRVIPV